MASIEGSVLTLGSIESIANLVVSIQGTFVFSDQFDGEVIRISAVLGPVEEIVVAGLRGERAVRSA